jgi:hypothetical protein
VKTRTIANLSHWAPERIEALRKALKGEFDGMDGEEVSGEIFGVLFALKQLADQVGMTRVLGKSEDIPLPTSQRGQSRNGLDTLSRIC